MPPQEEAFQFDDAVVWEAAGVDKFNEPTVLTPYSIVVRWDANSSKGVDQTGQLVRYDASLQTSEEYPIGSIFWLGKIEDLEDPPVDLFRSVSKDETNDIRGVDVDRHYNLVRFNDSLPQIIGTG